MLVGLIDDVLIDLVHDHIGVVLHGKLGDLLQLRTGEDLAAGVGRVADQDSLRTLLERIFQDVGIIVKVRRYQRNENRLTAHQKGLGAVILKIGREHDDLVAGVGDGKQSIHHGFSGADSHDHFRLRVQGAAHPFAAFFCQCAAEIGRAHGNGILVRAKRADLGEAVRQFLGRIKIREALGQVDGIIGNGDTGHAPDDGISKILAFSAHFLHG